MVGIGAVCLIIILSLGWGLTYSMYKREHNRMQLVVTYIIFEHKRILIPKKGSSVVQLLGIRKRMMTILKRIDVERYLPKERLTKFRK